MGITPPPSPRGGFENPPCLLPVLSADMERSSEKKRQAAFLPRSKGIVEGHVRFGLLFLALPHKRL